MGDLVRGFNPWVHHTLNENDAQCERMRSSPMHSYSSPRKARLGFEKRELATRSSPSGYAASPTKQVYLYKWFLIRATGNDPESDINHDRVQVALGGYTTSDLLDTEKFTTAPIESRIEKCKLRTVDGLNILLMGLIDDQCTYNNGFPLQVTHLFLTGFPFNWNHVINLYFGQPRLSRSVLLARKVEENSGQQKDEALNSEHVGRQIKGVGTSILSFQEPRENVSEATSPRESSAECRKRGKSGMQPSVLSVGKGEDNTGQQTDEVLDSEHVRKQVERVETGELSFQEPGENLSKEEENMLNVTSPRESSARCSNRGKCKIQPIRSSKRFKCDRLNTKSETGTPPLVDLNEDSNALRESTGYVSSVFRTESVKKEVKTPQPKFSDIDIHEQTDMDGNLMVPVHHTAKDYVKGKKNVSKSVISQSIKGHRVSKSQIKSRIFLDANKLTASAKTVNLASNSENQTNSNSPSVDDGAKQALVNKETEQPPVANVLLENKCTSEGEQTLDIQISALEFPKTSCKKSKLKSKVKLSSKRDGRNVLPLLPKGILCDETTVTECENMKSDAHLEEGICTRPLDAEHNSFGPKSRLLPNEIIGPGTDDKGQCEVNSLVDAGELGFHLEKDALSGSVDNVPCQVAENHISNRSLETKRCRKRLKLSDSPCEQSKEFVSNQPTVMDGMMKKYNCIDATRGCNPYLVPCEIQHDMASKNCAEIGSNCPDKIGDKEEGCLHTQRSSTKKIHQTSTIKSHNPKEFLPIPPRRVKTTPEEVSKAFGLKTSRSGRLIVPPLAHWCNQTIAYDLDGGIIAIFDGSSQREENESVFNFKPPQEKDAVQIRQKLCNAANKILRTPSSVKKTRKI